MLERMPEKILNQNMELLRKLLPLFSIVGFAMTFIAIYSNDLEIIVANNLLLGIASLILLMTDILFIQVSRGRHNKRTPKWQTRIEVIFVHANLIVFLMWGTIMIGYRPNSMVAIFDYVLIVLISGLVLNIPWQQFGLYITGSLIYLFMMTPLMSFKVETHYIMEISLIIFEIIAVYLSYISYTKTWRNFEMQEELLQQSMNLEKIIKNKTDELKVQESALSMEIIQVLVGILGYHDVNSKNHSLYVSELSEAIAKEMHFNIAFQKMIYWAGLIHDVGKIKVEKGILNKEGYLNNVEYDLLKQHPRYSYEMTKDIPALKEISKIIFHHHERYDGRGYPLGLKGEAIPKASQILAVADAWDAMRSPRNYREALSYDEAIGEINQNSGTQFAPDVVEVFLKMESRDK